MADDRSEIEKIVGLFYSFISGPKEKKKEISRLAEIFHGKNSITIVRHDKSIVDYSLGDYMGRISDSLEGIDFFEEGYSNDIAITGRIASVHNKYRAFPDASGTCEMKRGNNIIIMAKYGTEWKIKNMIWEDEGF